MKALQREVEDVTDEKQIIMRNYTGTVRDLKRQLAQLSKQVDKQAEGQQQRMRPSASFGNMAQPPASLSLATGASGLASSSCDIGSRGNGDAQSRHSRSPSQTSVNTEGLHPAVETSPDHASVGSGAIASNHSHSVSIAELDKQCLIERIIRLQRRIVRKEEKIDFLSDHVSQLTDELKRKTRVIAAYAMNVENVGAVSPPDLDELRAQQPKHGIMASIYWRNSSLGQSSDGSGGLTLDLALEINKKLQAVLEDTLFKNITLKESLQTLGEEISMLKNEAERRQQQQRPPPSRPSIEPDLEQASTRSTDGRIGRPP